MISDRLVFTHPILHELRRRYVVKLVRIDAHEPIAIAHLLSRDVKHVAAQPRLRKINRLFAHRHYAFVVAGEVLNYLPRVIDAAGIKHVNRIRPLQRLLQTLADNVRFIANRKKSCKVSAHYNRWVSLLMVCGGPQC